MVTKSEYERNIEKIREIIDKEHNAVRAPESKEIFEILRIMFNEEEAAIGAKMTTIPEKPEVIAERLEMKKEELIPVLEQMCNNGPVFRVGEKDDYLYSLLPVDPGLLTTCLGKGEDNERARELGKLCSKYIDGSLKEAFAPLGEGKTNILRIVLIEEKISSDQEILPYERVKQIIENVSYVSVTNCACRMSKKLSGQECHINGPLETCMLFDEFGKHLVERGFAREISKKEALEIKKRATDKGLFHVTINSKKAAGGICSCCSCCCVAAKSIKQSQENHMDTFARSSCFSLINRKACDGCKDLSNAVCINRCPMGAISFKDGKALCNVARCIGCGLCAHFCPVEGAITLKKRKNILEPRDDFEDYMTTLIKERKEASNAS